MNRQAVTGFWPKSINARPELVRIVGFRHMRTIRKYLWATLIWAMVPVTLVAGTPRMACICANGQYKEFCERHLNPCCRTGRDQTTEKGLCSCCHKHELAKSRRTAADKSETVAGCCQSHRSTGCPGGQAQSERCCKPVAVVPLLPPVVQILVLPDLTPMALLVSSDNLLQATMVSPTRESAWNPALPVPDLVIAHQVFLI